MTSQERTPQSFSAAGNLSQAEALILEVRQAYGLPEPRHDERTYAGREEKTARIRELLGDVKRIMAEITRLDSAS